MSVCLSVTSWCTVLSMTCYVKADRLGFEPTTCLSQVQRPTATPTRNTVQGRHVVAIVSYVSVYFLHAVFVFFIPIECREKKSETMLYLAGNNRLVSNQPLTDDDVEVLCAVLSANTYVTALDLRYNYLTDVGAQHLAKLLLVRSRCVNF